MPQQYVLDYIYSMNGLPPYTLPMPTGWVTVSNPRINDVPMAGPPYTASVPSGVAFTFKYNIVVSSSVPFSPLGQHIYGNIVYYGTTTSITEADGSWDSVETSAGSFEVTVTFTNGITTAKSLALNVGHYEYALAAQSNNSSWGTVAIQSPAATYYPNQIVTITASPIGSATFVNWTIGGTPIGTSTTLNYSMGAADTTIIGNFQSAGCTTGETQCVDGIKWVCINGVWQQTTQPCCNLNDVKCQDEQVFICDNNNNWVPSGVICCVPGTDKCIEGKWNTCNPAGDDWIPSEYACQQNIPIEYIIIGGIAVVGGLVALAAASGGLGGYAVGRRRR